MTDAAPPPLVPTLEGTRPTLSDRDAARLAQAWYDLTVLAQPLPSERDQNFHLTTADGAMYVLKVASAADEEPVLAMQLAALAHVAQRDGAVPVPRLVPTTEGLPMRQLEQEGRRHWIRLFTWLPGETLATRRHHPARLLEHVGHTLGTLDRALETFAHPAAQRPLYWDLLRAPEVIAHGLEAVEDAHHRSLLQRVLTRWREDVTPHEPTLRRSVIYNDANDHNLLVDGDDVTGLLDFGDMLHSATVAEPAIAGAYAALGKRDPVAAIAYVTAGYHAANPLTETELAVLPTLALARLAVSVTVAAQRRTEEPERIYLSVSEAPAWRTLDALLDVHHRLQQARLRAACDLEPAPTRGAVTAWLSRQPEPAAVIEPDPRSATRTALDLSVGSPDLPDPAGLTGNEAFCALIDRLMSGTRAAVGIGRYDEARLLYQAPQFTGRGEPRTIHLGVDLFAAAGTPVRTPFDATVHAVRENAEHLDYGPTVILEHDADGTPFYTLYGHLGRDCLTRLWPGQHLDRGAAFGELGRFEENGHWPPHLHFQIVTDLLDRDGEFPGVAPPGERQVWLSLCPDPNLVLRVPEGVRARTPALDTMLDRRRERLGPSLSLAYARPLHIVRGRGAYLYDTEGRAFLDGVNNVCHVGHAHPYVVRAATRQMAVLNTNTRYLHEHVLRYAERLSATLPEPLRVCFFVNSGSEANELALRMARAATGRSDVVVLDGGYHGNTSGLIDVSPYKFAGPGGAGAPRHVHVALMPDDYRGPFRRDDPDRATKYADDVRDTLVEAAEEGRRVGAFLAESLLSCGGQIEPPPGYLHRAYAHARDHGALCIADEVQVGLGRVGSHWWGFETQDVVPDIVTMGKPLGNGHPLAAVVTTPDVARAFANGMEYFNTFGGNPVSCAVGLAVLDVMEREGLRDQARLVGDALIEGLRDVQRRHPALGDVRGRGLFLGIELVRDPEERAPWPEAARYVVERLREEYRMLVSTDGPDANVIKIKPPLVFSQTDAERVIEALDDVLGELRE